MSQARKPGVITVREISEVLGIGKNKSYELIQAAYISPYKYFPVFKIGSSYKVPKQPFYKWLNSSEQKDF